mmetsp:Transcript_18966/g.33287  ORF Transcript_18966/g.33287 Transcript_18966/m.33287 type:complete len:121 (+) Transcript_18966:2-364(+)
MISPDLEDNDIFIKLTEEARRERLRRLDAGEESARLRFATGQQSAAKAQAAAKAPMIVPGKGVGPQQMRPQMQMQSGPAHLQMGMPRPAGPWGQAPNAFGVPLAQQRAMMARQGFAPTWN